jgi:hypothetical protein
MFGDLDHPYMLQYMCDCAVPYLENDGAQTRKEAALACTRLIERRGGGGAWAQVYPNSPDTDRKTKQCTSYASARS